MLRRALRFSSTLLRSVWADPRQAIDAVKMTAPFARGLRFGGSVRAERKLLKETIKHDRNPLRQYFDNHTDGPGIWKWTHYFDIYHRHFERFIGRDVHVMEVGVYSGGSLPMWREYFGKNCQIYGVDIEKACEVYRSDQIEIMIGDQSDRAFWEDIRKSIPRVDILIDDGSHHPEHQIITLEEMLPHLSPGGIYLCEDLHGVPNYHAAYIAGIASLMNGGQSSRLALEIDSIHLYPAVAVIEKCEFDRSHLSEKRGTQWQPFLG